MKKITLISLLNVIVCTSVAAMPLISFSGSATSGASMIDQNSSYSDGSKNNQFNTAANLIIHSDFSSSLSMSIDLGAGISDNQIGFKEGVVLQGININYAPDDYNVKYKLGRIPVLFGQFSESNTRNSKFKGLFVFNDLASSFLTSGNSVQGFSSNGIAMNYNWEKNGDVDFYIINGTSDNNTDGSFGMGIRYLNSSIINNVTFGVSAINSNDSNNLATGFESNITAYALDLKSSIMNIEFGAQYSEFNVDDNDSSTNDGVISIMTYATTTLNKIKIAARYSLWRPTDGDGSGDGISSGIINPGLGRDSSSLSIVTDIDIARIQLAAIIPIEDNFNVHNELIFDMYGDSDFNSGAILSYASITF